MIGYFTASFSACWCTWESRGLQKYTWVNMRNRGVQEYTWVNMRIQGFTGVYMDKHENTGVNRRVNMGGHMNTGVCRGIHG